MWIDIADGIASVLLKAADTITHVTPTESNPAASAELDDEPVVKRLAKMMTVDFARELADPEHPISEEVLERIQIAVAWEYSTGTDAMAKRCLELTGEVVKAEPRESVLRYLRRLSRCYIAGFFPECVILCRAILENAVKEKFDSKGIPLPANAEGQSSMGARLQAAHRFNWLSAQGKKDADLIWLRGNTAVHTDPDATKDVLGTIRMTLRVLGELYQ